MRTFSLEALHLERLEQLVDFGGSLAQASPQP